MGAKFKNHTKVPQQNEVKTRKQLRKEKRKEKKSKKNEWYTTRNKPGKYVVNPNKDDEESNSIPKKTVLKNESISEKPVQGLSVEQQRKKEQKEQKNLEKEMQKQRRLQLIEANKIEERNIKQLEKQLNLNKRKSKGIPKSFIEDGLGYLLEVCDSEHMKDAVEAEKELLNANDDFDEDFALMTGSKIKSKSKINQNNQDTSENNEEEFDDENDGLDDFEDLLNEDDESDLDLGEEEEYEDINEEDLQEDYSSDEADLKFKAGINKKDITESDNDVEHGDSDGSEQLVNKKRKKSNGNVNKSKKKVKFADDSSDEDTEELEENSDADVLADNSDEDNLDSENKEEISKSKSKMNPDGTWEDIYGRLRGKDGSVITNNEQKYIPPAVRAKMEAGTSESDKKRSEKLSRLRKQIKGLLNRLAESNMHSIASQMEELYMNNSRNDMNDTLTSLVMESVISNVITPERLLMEHVLLITILHANVGTEVGAHFLQTIVKKFDEYHRDGHPVENKMLDNTVNVIAQLYNFKLFDSKLVYEVLDRLSEKFEEKDVECILHILKAIGFGLRKDDPLALKNLILNLQKQAASVSEATRDNSRIKFMLDILLAIKNNNVTKIPNYDTSYSEHLKKIMKGFIRKGNYISQLNISLDDLLKADERGKWWVVGSAWTGNISETSEKINQNKSEGFSTKLLELARKQRMNTDTRRNIFCIIMSAEDYLDAFEKLLKLGLKNQQEREIVHVILHCCLHEKVYNPYYSVLAQKFCEYDRKFQMTIKYSIWDKLKVLNEHSGSQISNLAKLLTHLFIEKGLPISTLKIVEFSELDKITLRFIRQILLGILLHNDVEAILGVFEKVALSDKLKMFRESLRLFIHHFLLRNLKSDTIDAEQKALLENRSKIVEKVLIAKESRAKF